MRKSDVTYVFSFTLLWRKRGNPASLCVNKEREFFFPVIIYAFNEIWETMLMKHVNNSFYSSHVLMRVPFHKRALEGDKDKYTTTILFIFFY